MVYYILIILLLIRFRIVFVNINIRIFFFFSLNNILVVCIIKYRNRAEIRDLYYNSPYWYTYLKIREIEQNLSALFY